MVEMGFKDQNNCLFGLVLNLNNRHEIIRHTLYYGKNVSQLLLDNPGMFFEGQSSYSLITDDLDCNTTENYLNG